MLKKYDDKLKIIRSERRTTAIHVVGDTVLVRTNYATTDKNIEELLVKHQNWIRKRLAVNCKNEEIFQLLGREYAIVKIASDKYGYKFESNVLYCYTSGDDELISIYDDIYLSYQEKLKGIVKHCVDNFPVKPKAVQIKRLKRTFGICHANNIISINLYVLKYSREFIEMVVYHELCHLSEMNHSARFYQILEKYSPDYRRIRKEARP